ncbi:hypothetical protein [Methanobrevibacter filiformis]|uniref:Uncharacterized protein n=1 Tax=Methanobrevibacter filiformis TaxID=55758 RepID=A0A166E2L4_9EURY|nr:hypothetical protein [Methanobrevibacter filiformis]KZX16210.1 hypothetical protein MBFIL_05400 [Methanobrevibacter filiformis]
MKIINIFVSGLDEVEKELTSLIKLIANLNSGISSIQGILFKIIGNEYIKQLELKIIEQEKRNNEFLISIEDILLYENKNKQFKFKNSYFTRIINNKKNNYKVIHDYENIYILVSGNSLKKGKYNLIKEFETFKQNEGQFLFYFTDKENIIDKRSQSKKTNANKEKKIEKFKKELKNEDFNYMNFYGEKQLKNIIKKELLDIISNLKYNFKKKTKEIKISSRTYATDHQYPIFYILTAIGKYLITYNPKENTPTKIAINDFLKKHSLIVNEYNSSFLKNSITDSAKHLMKTEMINPSIKDSKSIINSIIQEYNEKKESEKVIEEIERYLHDHGFNDNEKLNKKIKNNAFLKFIEKNNENSEESDNLDEIEELGEFSDFGLFKRFDYKNLYTITPILEYIYYNKNDDKKYNKNDDKKYNKNDDKKYNKNDDKNENQVNEEEHFIRKFLKDIKKELKRPEINPYLMYLTSFFYDFNEELSYFQDYFVELFVNGTIENFYEIEDDEFEKEIQDYEESSEVEDDFYKEFEHDLFKDIDETESDIGQFIIATNDFIDDWSSHYSILQEKIIKPFNNNIKLLIIFILYINSENHDSYLYKLYVLMDYLQYELQISLSYLNDIKELNESLNEIKVKKINKQYDILRKSINKWKTNIRKIKKGIEIVSELK